MDAKACQASSQSYRNPGCRWMGTQHSANSVTARKTSAPAPHTQNVQSRVLAACLRLWQCPPAAAAVGVCCMCKDTLCPQPPAPALREHEHSPRWQLTPEHNTQNQLAGLTRCCFPKHHPWAMGLLESHEGAAGRFRVATMPISRLPPPPWQRCVGVFTYRIKNLNSLRDELLYGNVIYLKAVGKENHWLSSCPKTAEWHHQRNRPMKNIYYSWRVQGQATNRKIKRAFEGREEEGGTGLLAALGTCGESPVLMKNRWNRT